MSLGRYRNAIGGAHNFGAGYEGDYFYCEYYSGLMRRLQFNGTAWVSGAPVAGPAQRRTTGRRVPDRRRRRARSRRRPLLREAVQRAPDRRARPHPRRSQRPDLTVVSGDGQPANAGQPVQHALVVRVTTPSGTPVAGAPVTFAVGAGGGREPAGRPHRRAGPRRVGLHASLELHAAARRHGDRSGNVLRRRSTWSGGD